MKRLTLGAAAVVFLITIGVLIRSVPARSTALPVIPFLSAPTATPIPTPTPQPELTEVSSPVGSAKIIGKKVSLASGSTSYTFSSQIDNAAPGTIFVKVAGPGEEYMLAPNGWSPDNRFVFVLHRQQGKLGAFVFRGTGEPFADGLIYHDVGALFVEAKTEYIIRDITGWDAPGLMHVTTNSATGRGPSYWFEVDSSSFIQLGTL